MYESTTESRGGRCKRLRVDGVIFRNSSQIDSKNLLPPRMIWWGYIPARRNGQYLECNSQAEHMGEHSGGVKKSVDGVRCLGSGGGEGEQHAVQTSGAHDGGVDNIWSISGGNNSYVDQRLEPVKFH